MKKNCILSLMAFLLLVAVKGQDQQNGTRIDQLQKIIPPSPTAASLGKYGDIPVGFYTGTPQINIPIYTVKEGDIQVPISLSYFAGGVKVGEIASNVGLQWSLNAGGTITRSVRGNPDESSKGYFFRDLRIAPLTIPIPSTLTDSQYMSLEALAYNNQDMEPDLFVYNFNGRSGKFFFDHNKNLHMVSPEDMKIEVANDFSSWTITDEVGTKYTFAAIETTTSSNPLNANDIEEVFTSTWYLTNITSKIGRQVNFNYTFHNIIQDQLASQTDYYSTGPQQPTNPCYTCPSKNGISTSSSYSKQEITAARLLSIQTPTTVVNFLPSNSERLDLTGDTAIERIKVWSNETHSYVKNFHLTYDYFTGSAQYSYTNPWILNQSTQNKRLKLVSVEDLPSDSMKGGSPLEHQFYYDETVMAPRNSFAQDHWGFYNGANSNSTLLPKTSDLPSGIAWGNRNSNGTYAAAGTLNKIVYPTGGRTEFLYEPNTTFTQQTVRYDSVQEVYAVDQLAGTITSANFAIDEAQDCQLTYDIDLEGYPLGDISPQLIVKDASNNTIINTTLNTGNTTSTYHFLAGTYTMILISPDMPHDFLHFRVDYKSGPVVQNITLAVGGIRIKQISEYDLISANPIVKKYVYPAVVAVFGPQSNDDYLFSNIERAGYVCEPDIPPYEQLGFKCYYSGRSSSCRASMGSISGGHIAYDSVTVLYGANAENGKSLHLFNFEYPNASNGFPYPSAMTYDDRNGLELAQKDYNSAGVLVNETNTSYFFGEKYRETSVKAGFIYDDPFHDALSDGRYVDQITYAAFQVISENARKVTKTVELYSQDGSGAIIGNTKYFYDDTLYTQPTREQRTDSKGDTITEYTRYPLDFTVSIGATGSALAVYNLQQKHLITTPVEKYTVKKLPSGTEYVTAGAFFTYKPDNLMPDKIYTLDIRQTIPLSQFSPSTITGANSFQKDSRYIEKIDFNLYDSYGNLLSEARTSNLTQSYIWDYQQNYPIAEIMNADTNAIAYTSFESDGTGHWIVGSSARDTTAGITGSCSYVLNSNISKTSLSSSRAYFVSYWTLNSVPFTITGTVRGYPTRGKTINGWTLYIHKISGQSSITITGSGHIDELRLYPVEAQMTSYTFSHWSV